MDWSKIVFCPNDVLDYKTLVASLVGTEHVFPEGVGEVFLERYRVMRRNFMTSCIMHEEDWRQGVLLRRQRCHGHGLDADR